MEKRKLNKKSIAILIICLVILIASIGVIAINNKNTNQGNNENNQNVEVKEEQKDNQNSVNEVVNGGKEENNEVNTNNTKPAQAAPVKNTNVKVPILCYHGVLDKPWGIQELFVKVDEFEAQMKYLSEQGYTPIFVSEIANAGNYEKPIIITFDDGYLDVYTNAYPILKKYNIKANIYLISGWINGDVYMTTEMAKEMANSPLIEVGSHTVTHKALAKLSEADIEYELSTSKKSLEEMIGKDVEVVAYPTGSYDNRVIKIAKKYYDYALSTVNGKEDPNKLNTYSLKRIYVYRKYNIDQFKKLF